MIASLLKALQGLLVETGGTVELVAIVGEAALMLKGHSLQSLVSRLAGGGEGHVVAGIGLVVATGVHEDAGAPTVAGGGVALVAQLFANSDRLLRHGQSLVVLAGVAQGIG